MTLMTTPTWCEYWPESHLSVPDPRLAPCVWQGVGNVHLGTLSGIFFFFLSPPLCPVSRYQTWLQPAVGAYSGPPCWIDNNKKKRKAVRAQQDLVSQSVADMASCHCSYDLLLLLLLLPKLLWGWDGANWWQVAVDFSSPGTGMSLHNIPCRVWHVYMHDTEIC